MNKNEYTAKQFQTQEKTFFRWRGLAWPGAFDGVTWPKGQGSIAKQLPAKRVALDWPCSKIMANVVGRGSRFPTSNNMPGGELLFAVAVAGAV